MTNQLFLKMSNINEINIDLQDRKINVDGENVRGGTLKNQISRLKNKDNLSTEERQKLKRLQIKYDEEIDKIDRPKRDRMNIGAEGTKDGVNGRNNFKEAGPKDGIPTPETDATKPPDLSTKGKHSENKIQYYESYEKEMENMKYLIEYMNNNKPNII